MKKILLFVLCAQLFATAKAQEVKNQSEIIRSNVSKGDYKIIADQYKSHGGVMNITDIKYDKNQPNEHFELELKEYPNSPTESTRNTTIQLFPDNIAFPVTYVKSVYEGNAKLQKAVGYVVREGRSVGADRVVFIKDYLFILHQWQSKDDYQIRFVLKSPKEDKNKTEQKTKKKKKGFFKSLKEGMQTSQAGGSTAVIEKLKAEVLQPYLDNATKKQEAYYAEWIKKPENVNTKKYIADVRVMMKKAMKKYNDDIFNSPEYQRMLAFRERYNNEMSMVAHNKTGRTIWFGSTKKAHTTGVGADSGSSKRIDCRSDMYYYFSKKSGTPGIKFYTANTNCGGSITVN